MIDLSIFKKGVTEKKKYIFLLYNLKNIEFVKILYSENVIEYYEVIYDKIKIIFKFYENKLIFNNLIFFFISLTAHLNSAGNDFNCDQLMLNVKTCHVI